ncbi:ATP-dependent Clp endopeptidase proteolytic subunit ClpP [Streptomyces sp. BK022]|nr:ATP-dependent Clp endopeptidase proteolytic subunit ClpP [Streptomyces sp. BK022]
MLLAAGAPGKRFALPGSRVVLRQPELAAPVQGQPSDLEIKAAELVRARELMEKLLVRHTGRDAAAVHAGLERERVLDAAGALEHGLVDGVVGARENVPGGR